MAQAPIQPRPRGDLSRVRARGTGTDKESESKNRVKFDVALKGIQPVNGAPETAELEEAKLFHEALAYVKPPAGSLKSQLLDFIMPSIPPGLLNGFIIRKNLQLLFDEMPDEDEDADATLFNGKKIVKRQLAMLKSLRQNSNKKSFEQKTEPQQEKKSQADNQPVKKVEPRRDA